MHGILFWLHHLKPVLNTLLVFLVLAAAPATLNAQRVLPPGVSDTLWSSLEAQLDRRPDSSFQFILPLVRDHCGRNFECLYQNYQHTMIRLERRFNLPAAIFVGEELVKVARRHKVLEVEAQTRYNLCRYQDALGNARLAAINIESALNLFERAGDQNKVVLCKYWKLKVSLRHRETEEVLPDMETLLGEARLLNRSEEHTSELQSH